MKSFSAGCALVVLLLLIGILVVPSDRERRALSASSRAASDVKAISDALADYWFDHKGVYPSSLEMLLATDARGHEYLEAFGGVLPLDPWKRAYQYTPPTPAHPTPGVLSLGADGKVGGEGESADIESDN